jgi:hypothetical protein
LIRAALSFIGSFTTPGSHFSACYRLRGEGTKLTLGKLQATFCQLKPLIGKVAPEYRIDFFSFAAITINTLFKMKKKLFMSAISLLMAGSAFCQTLNLSISPVPGQPCHRVLNIDTGGWWYTIKVKRAWPVPPPSGFSVFFYAFPPNNPPFGGSHGPGTAQFQLAVNSSVATLYKVELKDITNPNPIIKYIVVPAAPCNYKLFKTTVGPTPNGRVASPEDPHEDQFTDMEVSWKLEEIDQTTGEPVFTLENPLNWASSNAAGASNAFKGFNGYNAAASVAALQAGDIAQDAGVFDPDKIYKVTRSVKFPDDDEWLESSVYFGPEMDEEEVEPWDETWGEERSASAELIGVPDLFTLGQNREAKTVIFTTTTDNGTLEIYDAAGNNVKTIRLQKEAFSYEMNAATFGKGMYVVSMQSGSQTTVKKFTIE